MDKKTLFEIPIYAMSKKEFNKRWNKKKAEMYKSFISHGHTDENAKMYVSNFTFPRCLWEYNQIIGYIKISVSKHDIWFDVYCSLDKSYYADSKQKHFIQNLHTNGTHFYVANLSEERIKATIHDWLICIQKDHLRKNFYVDYSTFNNVIDFVNIEQIMKTL